MLVGVGPWPLSHYLHPSQVPQWIRTRRHSAWRTLTRCESNSLCSSAGRKWKRKWMESKETKLGLVVTGSCFGHSCIVLVYLENVEGRGKSPYFLWKGEDDASALVGSFPDIVSPLHELGLKRIKRISDFELLIGKLPISQTYASASCWHFEELRLGSCWDLRGRRKSGWHRDLLASLRNLRFLSKPSCVKKGLARVLSSCHLMIGR